MNCCISFGDEYSAIKNVNDAIKMLNSWYEKLKRIYDDIVPGETYRITLGFINPFYWQVVKLDRFLDSHFAKRENLEIARDYGVTAYRNVKNIFRILNELSLKDYLTEGEAEGVFVKDRVGQLLYNVENLKGLMIKF